MLKKLLKKQQGFTLIEIVMVMAIAGLIMVVVFLAIGGAQKSRRDNDRRAAVSRILAAAEQVAGTNNGAYPANCAEVNVAYNPGNTGNQYICRNPLGAPTPDTPTTATLPSDQVTFFPGKDCTNNPDAKWVAASIKFETTNSIVCEDNK